ncbi:MAG: hypothetical protein CVU87_13305, partial [Firmicutes bacterium HGW-Firmicutes-12]
LSLQAIISTFARFPITLLLFISLTILIIYRIETPYDQLKDIELTLDRLTGVIALGIPFSLSISLLTERLGQINNLLIRALTYIAEILFLFVYYSFFFTDTQTVSVIRLLLIILAFVLSFLFIPYIPKKSNFEVYVTTLMTKAATTAFYTFMLALGLVAILFAVKSLLYNDMNPELYAETWIVACLIFAPLHFLHNVPYLNESFTVDNYNKVLKIMLLYIALPVITAYTIVLYIYFGKIIITQVWPSGIVSYLVVSYTAAGIAAIFFVSPFKGENKWVRLFTTSFTKLIFPLLIMMFISIGMRISEFGFTENRYFILVIGLWSTGIMVYLNINKGKNSTLLPISLAIFAFLTVCGPWNAFEVSKTSQTHRFYQIAVKYDLIQNGHVAATSNPVETIDQREITGILQYFNREHELKDLKYLPADFDMSKMKDVFGFSEVYSIARTEESFYYGGDRNIPLTINGFAYLFPLEFYEHQSNSENTYEQKLFSDNNALKLVVNSESMLTFYNNEKTLYQYDLKNYFEELYDKYGSNLAKTKSPDASSNEVNDNLIFTDENESIQIKIVFYSINGAMDLEDNNLNINHIQGDVFLTIK